MTQVPQDKTIQRCKDIKGRTEAYWQKYCQGADARTRYRHYITTLLADELRCAGREKSSCDVLVLMIGFSFEPLLQVIALYQPTQLLPVLNTNYRTQDGDEGGIEFFEERFKPLLELLACEELEEFRLKQTPQILPVERGRSLEPAGDDPVRVFQFLCRELLPLLCNSDGTRSDRHVVIDITGAKKSMVSGAYLFAAYADVPVSYVDFRQYDPIFGRPYGYTCEIGKLDNPTEMFKLEEWARARELYEQYAFQAVHQLLEKELISAMQAASSKTADQLFKEDQIEAARRLKRMMTAYQRWDEGDYTGAFQYWTELRKHWPDDLKPCPEPPDAVMLLGMEDYWPNAVTIKELLEQVEQLERNLYFDPKRLLTYARDELDKVCRLVEKREDYRSALLRAAGLSEMLLKARLVHLWMEGRLMLHQNGSFRSRNELSDDGGRQDWDVRLACGTMIGPAKIVKLLKGKSERVRLLKRKSEKVQEINEDTLIELKQRVGPKKLERFWKNSGLHPQQLADLRNKAIHFCIPVSGDLARKALRHALFNLMDLENPWLTSVALETNTEAPPWHSLCASCGINFLPPFKGTT